MIEDKTIAFLAIDAQACALIEHLTAMLIPAVYLGLGDEVEAIRDSINALWLASRAECAQAFVRH